MLGDMYNNCPIRPAACLACFIFLICSGCATRGYFRHHEPHSVTKAAPPATYDLEARPRSLPMFTSNGDGPINWQDLLNAVAWADVIILGEQHDDSVAHAVQLAIVKDTIQRFPGTALSMEMLDREEQTLVDDYLADIIKLDMFLEKTASTKWLRIARNYINEEIDREKFEERILKIGWPQWEKDYQPIIDVAKENNARVIAANTPWIRYMSLASREGFDRLDSLTDAQKRLFAYPKQESYSGYRERFWQVMAGRAEGEVLPEPEETEDSDEDESAGVHPDLTDEQVKGAFRGQLTMDATMADSIVKALNSGSKKVVHLVGQFHSDFQGGTIQELRQRKRGIKILNISMQRAEVVALRDEDRGRADIIIYTPEREEEEIEVEEVEEVETDAEQDTSDEKADPPATQPASQPTSQPASQPAPHPTTKPATKKSDDG